MTTVFWISRLKPGVAAADYEKWLREFDYVKARELSSILSYRAHRVHDHFLPAEGGRPFDYLEVIEITDLDEYRKQLAEHPAAQAIAAEWGNYVELVYSLHGEFLGPGVARA
jgi:hypothetical protein